ncbi:MAG: glycosyltransferase family 39 protein [Oscillospiraceae bacterium]|nr:glycosyltransferase family 39 protein [Oscillospiraceae bacterium]
MKKNNINDTLKSPRLPVAVLCFIPLLSVIAAHCLNITDEANVMFLMRCAILCVGLCAVADAYKGRLTSEKIIFLLLFIGVIMRCGYTVYTHAFTRSHDIGVNNETGVGHWGYINHVMNGRLPPSNEYQFYQPPFYYMISSLFIRIAMIFTGSRKWSDFMFMAQTVSCTASVIGLITLPAVMNKLNIKKSAQIIPVAVTALYPVQFMTAGSMNNDALVFMFMMLSLYSTLLWARERRLKYIIFIALSTGFGMMTKINCGVTALITGPIMLYFLFTGICSGKRCELKSLIFQLCVFAVIVFPLGLWYPIRNLILFDQPLNYVHILGTNSFVYTGDASWYDRWLNIPFFDFIKNPYTDMGSDTSIWMLLIKTGVHGEWSFDWLAPAAAWLIEYVHAAVILMTVISAVFSVIRLKGNKAAVYSSGAVWGLMTILYIMFNIQYPYSCSADFRYMLLWQVSGAALTGIFAEYLKNTGNKLSVCAYNTICVLTASFCILSVIHFCR